MSDSTSNGEELTKMKLGDLKKLCKKHNLSTTGTKVELISRLVENNSESFTILQPGDEDKLLGDVDDIESAGLDIPLEKKPTVSVTVDEVAPVTEAVTSPGSKRPASEITMEPKSPVELVKVQASSDHEATDTPEKTDAESAKSDPDRLSARANRFGLSRPMGTLSDDKLAARARRFGLPVNDSASPGLRNQSSNPDDDAEKRRKRAERFGTAYSDTASEIERKARRLERFGALEQSSLTQSEEEKLKAARAIKFGLQTDEEKLMKRKARFGVA